ncbi:MAG: V-type ATP synthase subunit F [Deltaproteobacteria bacterium]
MVFFCIADRESGLGFRLAGVETRDVSSRDEALDALSAARSDKDVGIILITSKAADLVRDEVSEHISLNPMPLILEVPSKGDFRPRKSAGELLRQIAGM